MFRNKMKYLAIGLILLVSVFSLTGCSKEEANIKDKIKEELQYIDAQIVFMMNSVNSIALNNYNVLPIEIEEDKVSGQSEGTGGSERSTEGEEEGSKKSGESQSTDNESSSSSQPSEDQQNQVRTKMIPNTILGREEVEPDWDTLKQTIENFQDTWSTIILDLYKANIPNEEIIGFSKQLDIVTVSIRDENREKAGVDLANLYAYLPRYSQSSLDETFDKNLYQSKSSILNAYALVETEKWEEVKNQMLAAEEHFNRILGDISSKPEKQYAINKTYILLKELQNSTDAKDKDIFYIKYKNLIAEMTMLSA